jgi:LPPG:FO 2-phospho-L-lactate transferase
MRVAALAGGVGGAKLLVGLQRAVGRELAAIVNTADDDEIYGVHVSPDVDIVTYWLAGIADTRRGWGIEGDTSTVVDALAELGMEAWFRLGDRDLATCLYRTERLRAGESLSAITRDVGAALGVVSSVLPMSDDRVRTQVTTRQGEVLAFQEYFVREKTAPEVTQVLFAGIEGAKPAPGVVEAIHESDVVVICPSNPILSVGPILALPGVRDALREHERVIAVTPIVAGAALKGPAARLLSSLASEASASGVARLYADFCDTFVVDSSDRSEAEPVDALGIRPVLLDTIMSDHEASEALARAVIRL